MSGIPAIAREAQTSRCLRPCQRRAPLRGRLELRRPETLIRGRISVGHPTTQRLCALGGLLVMPAMAHAAGSEIPEPGSYISIFKVVLVLMCVFPWLLFCQWVDRDTQVVRKLNRELWNGVALGGGVVGLIVWLFMPWNTGGLFAAGFALWFAITVGSCATYVIIRNGQVDTGARVFTIRHIKTKLAGGSKKQQQLAAAIERVRVNGSNGARIPPPTDPNEVDAYESAQMILFDALWRRATDAELMVSAGGTKLAYRIDGVITNRSDLFDREHAERALRFVKRAAGLDLEERRKPQRGSISGAITGMDGGSTEIEVLSSGTTQHERLTLRIVAEENRLRVSDLGMSEKQETRVDELASTEKGLILVSGPKANGITTTLYALLRSHDAFMQNLLTLEKSPMMDLENITQSVYDETKHEASYARQLQTVLRREPDVVMVSDCNDRETAHLAAKAAREGKKIYMGMQARDSFDALKKLVSLAGDTDTVADGLQAVLSQRLARKLCIACRQAYKPDQELLRRANLPVDKIDHFFRPPPEGLVDQKGNPIICSNCQGSGYYGRTGIFELLVIDDEVRELIRKGQPINAVKTQSRKSGMLYLQEVALQKVIAGITSMNEILRVMRDDNGGKGG